MELRRYGCWAGMPRGVAEDVTRCIEEVTPAGRSIIQSQCGRKRGHGKDGLYCKQHARMQERKLTQRAPDSLKSGENSQPEIVVVENALPAVSG